MAECLEGRDQESIQLILDGECRFVFGDYLVFIKCSCDMNDQWSL